MNLTPIRANMTEVDLGNGRRVLFSYKTPVAYSDITPAGRRYYMTEKRWSNTTSRHIGQWLPKDQAIVHPQEWFDDLASNIQGGI